MSRWFRTFPGHANVGQRQALDVPPTRLILPVVVGVAAMAAPQHLDRNRDAHIIAPRPMALAVPVQVTVTPPRPVVVTAAEKRQARRGSRIVTIRSAALANHAVLSAGLPRTVSVVDTATPSRQRRPSHILEPRPYGLIFTPAAAANPPRTVYVVEAPQRRRARGGAVIAPRPVFAPILPPRPVVVDQAAFQRRQRPLGRVVAPFKRFGVVVPPKPVIVDQAAFQQRRRRGSRIIVPWQRPTTATPPAQIVVTEYLGYVAVGDEAIPGQILAQGTVNVGSTGIPGVLGDTAYPTLLYAPQDVCVLGYSNQNLGTTDIPTIEAEIGRSFHGLRQNQQYTNTSISTAITEYDAGRTLSYRSIQFNTAPGGWAAAATGTFDTQLVALCNAITAANRWTTQNPFWLCLHHEATTSGGVFGTPGFSAADHIAMWQHCVPVMRATGAPIKFAYVGWDRMFVGLNGVGPPDPGEGFDDLDPGTAYYDRIGSDPYNAVDSPGVLRYGTDAAVLLEPIRLAAVARGMDWMMGEMGCQDGATQADHDNKAAWTDSLRTYLDGLGTIGPGVCRVMLTTHESANLYQADTSAESLAAWQRLGFDSYYS